MGKLKSIKINYILNITRTILSTLIGLMIFPYVNKVLGVDSVGKYEYANSIITYFVLFSSLGIPMYGIREIAKVRDDKFKQTKTVVELLFILFFTTFISYVILFFVLNNVVSLSSYKDLLLIISPTIIMTSIGMEWFFQGIEDQLYITIRFVIVKVITLILLFSLVKDSDDILIYAGITTFSLVGSNIFNFFYIKKYLNFSGISFKNLNVKRHLPGIFTIFLATISISVYLQMDNTLLGYLVGDRYVGLYSTANKLIRFAILFVTTLGAVMLPRLSYLYENNQKKEYNNYLQRSLKYILFFSVPISVIMFISSDEIISIMAGNEFREAIISMKILSPLVLIIGLAYFLAFMVLYPQGKEKLYTLVVFISAIFSIILNFIYIPKYFHVATAWVSLSVETLGGVLMVFFTRKQLMNIRFFHFKNLNYFIGSGLILFFLNSFNFEKNIVLLALKIFLSLLIYVIFLYLMKDSVVIEVFNKLLNYKKRLIK